MRVVSLHRYPVKSLGGEAIPVSWVEPRGLAGDRRWMVTTPDGRFLTRREISGLARLHAHWRPGAIDLSHADPEAMRNTLGVAEPDHDTLTQVRIWGDKVMARDAGEPAAQWLSDAIGRPVRLMHIADDCPRPVDPDYAQEGDEVGFADGFPLLITLVESLEALNLHLSENIVMERFRSNIVVSGAPAFSEDGWSRLRIGDVVIRVVKPCTRCVITTQDPESGVVTTPMEPLRTLKALGRVMPGSKEPIFGQNAIPDGPGMISVGDIIEVLD